MAHARTPIRNAVVFALIAASTNATSRVFTIERDANNSVADTPFIRVAIDSENQLPSSMGGGRTTRAIERTATVKVTYVCMQAANFLEDTDDALALIETALANLVGSGIKDVTPSGVSFAVDTTGEASIYSAEQSFDIFYITPQGTPATTYKRRNIMPIAVGVARQPAYKVEATWGVLPSAGGAQLLRRTKLALNLKKDTYTSAEIRTDY